jgi:hypothetical protein
LDHGLADAAGSSGDNSDSFGEYDFVRKIGHALSLQNEGRKVLARGC